MLTVPQTANVYPQTHTASKVAVWRLTQTLDWGGCWPLEGFGLLPFSVLWHSLSYSEFPVNSKSQHKLTSSGWVEKGETYGDVCLLSPQGGRLGGNRGCSFCTMTLISVHYALTLHHLRSMQNWCVCGWVGWVGVGMVNTTMCFLCVVVENNNFAHDLSMWRMIIFKIYIYIYILEGFQEDTERAQHNCRYTKI